LLINIKQQFGHQGSSNRYIKMHEKAELYSLIINS